MRHASLEKSRAVPSQHEEFHCKGQSSGTSLNQSPTGTEYIARRLGMAGHKSARHLGTKPRFADGPRTINRLVDALLGAHSIPSSGVKFSNPKPAAVESRNRTGEGMNKRDSSDVRSARFIRTACASPRQCAPDPLDHSKAHRASPPPARLQMPRSYGGHEIPF
jgi:hypothetical protein